MHNFKSKLIWLIAVAASTSGLLVVAGRDILTLISPLDLILCAGLGALLLIGILTLQEADVERGRPAGEESLALDDMGELARAQPDTIPWTPPADADRPVETPKP